MIFVIISCREKTRDNKESRRENSKPHRESRITTPLSRTVLVLECFTHSWCPSITKLEEV